MSDGISGKIAPSLWSMTFMDVWRLIQASPRW
jgi:hypothetical protein